MTEKMKEQYKALITLPFLEQNAIFFSVLVSCEFMLLLGYRDAHLESSPFVLY